MQYFWFILSFCFLPTHEFYVVDRYDAVVWNVYGRTGDKRTQLLFMNFTRNGDRVEDWRIMLRQPTVVKRPRGVIVYFWDDRQKVFRKVYSRSYSVIKSIPDLDLMNRDDHPLTHRRNLSDGRLPHRSEMR